MRPGQAYASALLLIGAGLVALAIAFTLPWLTVAALVGVIATRSWGRTLVAVLLGVAGLAGVIAAFSSESASIVGVAGGAVLMTGSVWTIAKGRQWPVMGARYESTAKRRPTALSDWDAQDRGIDPTADDSASG